MDATKILPVTNMQKPSSPLLTPELRGDGQQSERQSVEQTYLEAEALFSLGEPSRHASGRLAVVVKAPIADELVWANVLRPAVPLVYLDLNHYIQLAKASRAASGHTNGDAGAIQVLPGYTELLQAARRAKADGRAKFPLSCVHFMEVAHSVPSPRQRGHVADLMEELSDFNYLPGRPTLTQMEIAAGLDKVYNSRPSYAPVRLLQPSALWGFGWLGGFKFEDDDGLDVEARFREELGAEAFEANLAGMNHFRERKLLEGPQDEEIAKLRALGYEPETYKLGMQGRLNFEIETSDILNANLSLRRGRLRDLIFARDVSHEWMTALVLHLTQREGDGFRSDLPSAQDLVSFWAAMPQVQVAISMKSNYHRQPERVWRTNDIADIDALAVAYAYCDALLTDKQARAALADSRDLRSFGAYLPIDSHEMAAWLDRLPSVRNKDESMSHPLPRSD